MRLRCFFGVGLLLERVSAAAAAAAAAVALYYKNDKRSFEQSVKVLLF